MTSRLKVLLLITLIIEIVSGQQVYLLAQNDKGQTKTSSSKVAPTIKARTMDNKEVLINYGIEKKQTILYVFSPSCSWSSSNWSSVNFLAKNIDKNSRFFGLALNANNLQEHLKTNQVSFPVYKELSSEAIGKLELGLAPQTIVISPTGKIIKSWTGAYSGDIQREIETFFRIKLPGVNVQNSSDSQFCAYCMWDGFLNSPGAVIKVDGKQIRCKQNGKWTTPY